MNTKQAVLLGIVAGALTSITPVELMFFMPAIAIVVLAFKADTLGRLVAVPGFVAMVLVALYAPLKWQDVNSIRPLRARCLTVAEIDRSMTRALPASALNTHVCFSTTTPTYREVGEVLHEAGLEMQVGYCGTGATVLFGMHPKEGPTFTLASAE